MGCKLLNMLAGDIGRPMCIVLTDMHLHAAIYFYWTQTNQQVDTWINHLPANNIWLQQRFHNVWGKLWKRWQIKLLQHIPGKFQERYHNVAAKRCKKTSPQHYGNICSFIWQSRSATTFTMLWQLGKSAKIISAHALENNWRSKKWCPHHFTGWLYVPLLVNKCP